MRKVLSFFVVMHLVSLTVNAQSNDSLTKFLYNKWILSEVIINNEKMDASQDGDYMTITKDSLTSSRRTYKFTKPYKLDSKNKTIVMNHGSGNISMKILSINSTELKVEYIHEGTPMTFIFKKS